MTVFVRVSWISAVCGILVLGHLLGAQPRSVADLGPFYFLVGYLGVVVTVVAAGVAALHHEEIVAARLRTAVIGHAISVVAVLLLFLRTTLPGATGLELIHVPVGFSLGQLPVLGTLIAHRYRRMP